MIASPFDVLPLPIFFYATLLHGSAVPWPIEPRCRMIRKKFFPEYDGTPPARSPPLQRRDIGCPIAWIVPNHEA